MATLSHFPNFHSLSSHKLSFSSPLPSPYSHIIHYQKCRCSTIVASSKTKKSPRVSRKAKSDADLRNDIKEFLSTVGLPENHVPTMKELSQNGRQDLANVVRRRGYKFIAQLLATPSVETGNESNIDSVPTGKVEVLGGSGGESLGDNIEGDYSDSSIETVEEFKPNDLSSVDEESDTLSLQEKVAKFVQHGELDTIEDNVFGISGKKHADDEGRDIQSEDSHETEAAFGHQQQEELILYSSDDAKMLNGNVPSAIRQVEDPELENSTSGNSYISTEEQPSIGRKDLNDEKVEYQAEVERLKFLLRQKEMELIRLKEQIQKDKLALTLLQTKAETEIQKAHKLISEKEAEFSVAEEMLSELQEVEIEYEGDGETVELAGSFNGWQQKIMMDLQPPSSTTKPTEPRSSRLWQTILWLYPGVYEIKFVVDGHWKIDPQRESVTRNRIQNNILRVDR